MTWKNATKLLKVLIGYLLIVFGTYWYFVDRVPYLSRYVVSAPAPFWHILLNMAVGVFGVLVILLGIKVIGSGLKE